MIKVPYGVLLALVAFACGAGAPDAPVPKGTSERVVAGSAGLGDIVCELLPPERLAGLPDQMRDYSGHRAAGDPFLQRPTFHVFTAEAVLALRPDLVVADRWQPVETVARLREAGVPVLLIEKLERLDDVRATLQLVARSVGEEARCESLLAGLDLRVRRLGEAPGARRGLRALAYTNGGTGGWAAGAGTSADEWMALAGLVNAAADREGHVRFTWEDVLAVDPDVLVVPGPDDADERGSTETLVREEDALAGLAARRRGLIVALPGWLFSTNSQHIVTAAEELARRLDELLAGAPP